MWNNKLISNGFYTFSGDFADVDALLFGHVPEDGEDDESGVDARSAVDERNDEGVTKDVVVKLVEGRHSDETAHGNTERVEDLCGCVGPHLRLSQSLPVGLELQSYL